VHYRWRAAKSINFLLKFYLIYLWERETSLDVLSKYLLIVELRFDVMLYSNLGCENSDVDHIICSHGLQIPHPWPNATDGIACRVQTTWIEFTEFGTSWLSTVCCFSPMCGTWDRNVSKSFALASAVSKVKSPVSRSLYFNSRLHKLGTSWSRITLSTRSVAPNSQTSAFSQSRNSNWATDFCCRIAENKLRSYNRLGLRSNFAANKAIVSLNVFASALGPAMA